MARNVVATVWYGMVWYGMVCYGMVGEEWCHDRLNFHVPGKKRSNAPAGGGIPEIHA